ncbi:hypothetical protein P7K49_021763, partial [Saguinus oedipus]
SELFQQKKSQRGHVLRLLLSNMAEIKPFENQQAFSLTRVVFVIADADDARIYYEEWWKPQIGTPG